MTTRMLLINVSAIRQLSGTDPNLDSTHIFYYFSQTIRLLQPQTEVNARRAR